MKFRKCFYLEPTMLSCHGADKQKTENGFVFNENNDDIFICLESGIIVDKTTKEITIRHISNLVGSYSDIRLFDATKTYTEDEIFGIKESAKRGRKSA